MMKLNWFKFCVFVFTITVLLLLILNLEFKCMADPMRLDWYHEENTLAPNTCSWVWICWGSAALRTLAQFNPQPNDIGKVIIITPILLMRKPRVKWRSKATGLVLRWDRATGVGTRVSSLSQSASVLQFQLYLPTHSMFPSPYTEAMGRICCFNDESSLGKC